MLLRRIFGKAKQPAPGEFDARVESDGKGARNAGALAMAAGDERNEYIVTAKERLASRDFGEALAAVRQGLLADPRDAELHFVRASVLFAWGRFREAQAAYAQARDMGWSHRDLYLQLGWSLLSTGNPTEAESSMRSAIALDETDGVAHFGLASALRGQQRLDEAVASFERARTLGADEFDSRVALGNCRLEQDDLAGAEAEFRHLVGMDQTSPTAWHYLGVTLDRQGRAAEAVHAIEQAVRLDQPDAPDAFVNLALGLRDSLRSAEAAAILEGKIAQRPSALGYLSYATALLMSGRLTEAWQFYEFRWLSEPQLSKRPKFGRPAWSGQDLRGRTILLLVEQGFGDVIQFVRYAALVKALGATVHLFASRVMVEMLRGVPGIDKVLGPGDALPDFDFYAHLMSLPRVFGTDLATIPADIPYVRVEPELVARWAHRFAVGNALKVGIVWSGANTSAATRLRSMDLNMLSPLRHVRGTQFFALQKGVTDDEIRSIVPDWSLVNLGPELANFSDRGAIVHLDLVICVDTAVGHLAGALGKPVWVMLHQPPDWRWQEAGDASPWYPATRLFRQQERGNWDEVVARVQVALEEVVRNGGAAALTPPAARDSSARSLQPSPAVRPGPGPGHRPGFSAVAETRHGILQYLPDDGDEGTAIGWYGEWLQPQLDLLARLLRPESTVLEVGAGIGAHAVWVAATLGGAGHLLLYETRPVQQRILRQNLAANRVSNVTLPHGTLGAAGAATLDAMQLEQLDWLKFDDGALSPCVLAGATETLWRLRPRLFIAAEDAAALERMAEDMKAYGYRCWRQETALFNPANFNRRGESVFGDRRALALLAIPEEVEVDVALPGCVELS